MSRQRQIGAVTAEFYITAWLAMLPLCLLILQMALVLIAHHQLDLAVFHSARTGAVAGGSMVAMRQGLAQGLTPLYLSAGAGSFDSSTVQAYGRAQLDLALNAQLEIESPSPQALQDFAVVRGGRRVIPNDALAYRSVSLGRLSAVSLQEANVLQLRVTYCHRLIVPLAAAILVNVMQTLDRNPANLQCYANDRLPLSSKAVMPMQSDFVVQR